MLMERPAKGVPGGNNYQLFSLIVVYMCSEIEYVRVFVSFVTFVLEKPWLTCRPGCHRLGSQSFRAVGQYTPTAATRKPRSTRA